MLLALVPRVEVEVVVAACPASHQTADVVAFGSTCPALAPIVVAANPAAAGAAVAESLPIHPCAAVDGYAVVVSFGLVDTAAVNTAAVDTAAVDTAAEGSNPAVAVPASTPAACTPGCPTAVHP